MMLATQLKLLKEKRGLTNQQLADLSGVPVGTVNRILSGQTDNPSFQTICDLVLAMDGSLDELAGIEKAPGGAGGQGPRQPRPDPPLRKNDRAQKPVDPPALCPRLSAWLHLHLPGDL